MSKKINLFVMGTSFASFYDTRSHELLAWNSTVQTNSIETSIDLNLLRGGVGNMPLIQIPHSPEMKGTLELRNYSLEGEAMAVGSAISYGAPVYFKEALTLGADKTFTLRATPVALPGNEQTKAYAYVGDDPKAYEVNTATRSFKYNDGVVGESYCVAYWVNDPAATRMTVNALFTPGVVASIISSPVYATDKPGDTSTSSKVGDLYTYIPRLQFNGTIARNLNQTEAAITKLDWTALAYEEVGGATACEAGNMVLAHSWIHLSNRKWYDAAVGLTVIGSGIAIGVGESVSLPVKGLSSDGKLIYLGSLEMKDLEYTCNPASIGTVSEDGVFTAGDTTGSGTIIVSTKDVIPVHIESLPIPVTVM